MDDRHPAPDPRQAHTAAHTLSERFDAAANNAPERTALEQGALRISYGELRQRAINIAHALKARNVAAGDRVALCLPRGFDNIAAQLAVVRTGAMYVPIDPLYPAERIALLLADSEPKLLITHSSLVAGLPRTTLATWLIDQAPAPANSAPFEPLDRPEAPAHILYTSGSTGKPKGVLVTHRGIVRLVTGQEIGGYGPDRTFLQSSNPSFDASTKEIWGALLNGARLVLPENEAVDLNTLAATIQRYGVDFMVFPTGLFNVMVDEHLDALRGVRTVFIGGDVLSNVHIKKAFAALGPGILINGYGPTEASVMIACKPILDPSDFAGPIAIGKPIPNTWVELIDADGKAVQGEGEGELIVSGPAVAVGYWRRPEESAERFLPDTTSSLPNALRYRTGDLVRRKADGELEFVGRSDDQVKVRGFRIELGEVLEAARKAPGLKDAAIAVKADAAGQKQLVGYLVPAQAGTAPIAQVREHLAKVLPPHAVPTSFVVLEALPLNANGKVDRKALPDPVRQRPTDNAVYSAPTTPQERAITAHWEAVLGMKGIGIDDNFFDLGGNSLLAIRCTARMAQDGLDLPIVKLYQHPTIRACAAHLAGSSVDTTAAARARKTRHNNAHSDVAIIGMAGKFPGAADVDTLWQNLLAARHGITTWTAAELDPSLPEALRNDPDYVKARGVLPDADRFDAAFFGIGPRQAQIMDPQHRILLETAWAAMEDAGYDPTAVEVPVGVFAGVNNNSYYLRNVLGHTAVVEAVGDTMLSTGNEKDYVATRVAFEFGLRGPALSLHTACSTSLVAIAEAFRALNAGDCDMALAGGASVTAPVRSGVRYTEGSMYSPDGHTRTFDANGQGTTFSDGSAVVVLKRLADALRDGDHIYAVVKGVGINNDGNDKASFTAPSVRGQAEVIAMAQADAGVSPAQIGYVETHGTATPLGDPIEVEALTQAFRTGDTRETAACAIGSIKSNLGHLTAAAGAAGAIKAALALHHGSIPANVGFERLNPAIDLSAGIFRIADTRIPWPRSGVARYAGVSSFGVGGTNAHIVLGEAPERQSDPTARKLQVLQVSGRTPEALEANTERLRTWAEANPNASLADAAWTLRIGRKQHAHRRAIVASSVSDLARVLADKDPNSIATRELRRQPIGTAFLFPGQGAQYAGMGSDLYASEAVFREHFDRCVALFNAELGGDLKSLLFATGRDADARLKRTEWTQPALFTMHYALAQLWISWGVRPTVMLGHSIGEFAAACLAGVFSLEDAVKLVALRGRAMQALPEGSMLSVRMPETELRPRLHAGCDIAANNGASLCVASGPTAAISALQQALEADGITCRLLVTSHAFHSPMMDPIVEQFRAAVAAVPRQAPSTPVISTVTAEVLSAQQATDPAYWAGHLRATVRFAEAARKAWELYDVVMLEVGPRTTASTLARQQADDPSVRFAVASLSDSAGDRREDRALQRAVGALWTGGIAVEAMRYHSGEKRLRIPLPTYAFARERHWLEPVALHASTATGPAIALSDEALPAQQKEPEAGTPKDRLIGRIKELLETSSGLDLGHVAPQTTFLEMGLDSLFLTQVATALTQRFGVRISFRQLSEQFPDLSSLADHLLPHDKQGSDTATVTEMPAVPANALEDAPDLKKTFGAQARIARDHVDITPEQEAWIHATIASYNLRTAKSKAFNQANRAHMADPRVVTGFKPQMKEAIYQLVVERSRDHMLWDIDGNAYVDMLNGFGSSMFGYMPDFIRAACHAQLDTATDIGPMSPLAADVTRMMCTLTGHDRAALCNTGSEAVLGALRMARTITGRSLVICFSGSYHGINDEVIIRGSKSHRSYPGAAGIMPEAVQNMLVLDYGTAESLEIIRQRCHEAAAIIVEPVQSRRMEFRPVDFLRELRRITSEHGTAFIFDEVITGFRMHPGGAQALFGIKADIATYGKVFGGGMPVGGMVGKREWMDALDGGHWSFGDDSVPEVGVTYFAGTFVRHPLTLAACKASLEFMIEQGPALQETLNARCDEFAKRANALFRHLEVPFNMVNFGSAMKLKYDEDLQWADLYFVLLRLNGVHTLDGFPNFLTIHHTPEVLEQVLSAMEHAMRAFKASGLVPERILDIPVVNRALEGILPDAAQAAQDASTPPEPGARLGRTPKGDPAWFVPDPERPGKWRMLTIENIT